MDPTRTLWAVIGAAIGAVTAWLVSDRWHRMTMDNATWEQEVVRDLLKQYIAPEPAAEPAPDPNQLPLPFDVRDPWDGYIREPSDGEAYEAPNLMNLPRVDPWYAAPAPDAYPETVMDAIWSPGEDEAATVQLPDGTWVPVADAFRPPDQGS